MEDYKQKYETAINQAKEELKACGDLNCDAARQIFRFFPELKESEDERIRKECISIIDAWDKSCRLQGDYCEVASKCIAWLKKQDIKLQVYINKERNKKDFYCEGEEMSWNDMPINVRKHDYPYYFKGDLDCYPFNVEKQSEQKPVTQV